MRKRVLEVAKRHERLISAATLVAAFVIDSVTLVRVDELLTNVILVAYLVIAGTGIIAINLKESGRFARLSPEGYFWLVIVVQFAFGGLFGRFLIYYTRSGSVAASWPFLVLLLIFLVGNELAKKYYTRLALQATFFYLALYSFLIYAVPVVLGRMGTDIFLISSVLSMGIMAIFLRFLFAVVPERIVGRRASLLGVMASITIVIFSLYSTNFIPPLPLALRAADVYHTVLKRGSAYVTRGEQRAAWQFFARPTIHLVAGDSLAVYSAVFAPANFGATIAHEWQYFDEADRTWKTVSTVSFPITGGHERGYRGYTIKSNIIRGGAWRVVVKTAGGQTIGRVTFTVALVDSPPALVETTLK